MTLTIPISQFRQDLFKLTDKLIKEGGEITVLKDGAQAFSIVPVSKKSMAQKTKEYLKKTKNRDLSLWKNYDPKSLFDEKLELDYFKNLGSWSKKAKKKGKR